MCDRWKVKVNVAKRREMRCSRDGGLGGAQVEKLERVVIKC